MQGRLSDHYGPVTVTPADMNKGLEHGVLLVIKGFQNHDEQMRVTFCKGQVLTRVIGRLAQSSRVEKADKWRFNRKVVDTG